MRFMKFRQSRFYFKTKNENRTSIVLFSNILARVLHGVFATTNRYTTSQLFTDQITLAILRHYMCIRSRADAREIQKRYDLGTRA